MQKFLLIRPDRVGDVVSMTPVIRELRRTYPDSFIATLTKTNTSAVLLNNPHINLILNDDYSPGGFWRTVKELRKHEFTHGLLMWPNERAAYQMFFAGIQIKIGVGHKLYQLFTGIKSVSRNKYIPVRHEADYSMDLARKIGVVSENLTPEIFLSDKERSEAKDFYKQRGVLNHEKVLVIHTGSLSSAPNWSESKYLSFVKYLINDDHFNNVKLFFTAREMSANFIDNAIALSPNRIFNIVNDTENLRTLIKIISAADSLICSSTGPLHLASALGINCIGLYCREDMRCVKRWGALSPLAVNLEISKEYCEQNCSENQQSCSFENGISIEDVISVLKKQL